MIGKAIQGEQYRSDGGLLGDDKWRAADRCDTDDGRRTGEREEGGEINNTMDIIKNRNLRYFILI